MLLQVDELQCVKAHECDCVDDEGALRPTHGHWNTTKIKDGRTCRLCTFHLNKKNVNFYAKLPKVYSEIAFSEIHVSVKIPKKN